MPEQWPLTYFINRAGTSKAGLTRKNPPALFRKSRTPLSQWTFQMGERFADVQRTMMQWFIAPAHEAATSISIGVFIWKVRVNFSTVLSERRWFLPAAPACMGK